MWVRGLKLQHPDMLFRRVVAPYVGAWIETRRGTFRSRQCQVAPYVGAWIETREEAEALFDCCRTLCGCVD